MSSKSEKFIKKVEEVLDPDRIKESLKRQKAAWNFRKVDYPPLIVNCPPPSWWPNFRYIEIFNDMDKMLISELASVYQHCAIGDDFIPCVRANYGVVVIPSAFGSEVYVPKNIFVFEKTYTVGPWAKPILNVNHPNLKNLKIPDPEKDGLMRRVLETEEYFIEKLENTGVRVCVCDTQGPLDIAHMLRGSKLITDFFKYPTFVDKLLEITSDVYIEFNKIQKSIIGEPLMQGVAKGVGDGIWMDKGGAMLRADSVIVLSPRLYRRFCKPIHEKSLRPFNGGLMHMCGNVNPLLEDILSTRGVRAINLGNPEMYKLSELLNLLHDKACLIWTGHPRPNQPLHEWIKEVASNLGDNRTGIIFSLYEGANNFEEARRIVTSWKEFFLK